MRILLERVAQGIHCARQVVQSRFRQLSDSPPESRPRARIIAARKPRLHQCRQLDEVAARLCQWFQDVEHAKRRFRARRQRTQGGQRHHVGGHTFECGPKSVDGTV